jgi:hypothetical protein
MSAEKWSKLYAGLSPQQKAESWDRYHGLTDRTWHLYTCSDCDPDPMLYDEENPPEYATKAMIVLPSDIERPEECPRCQSYLGLGDPMVVRVTTLGTKPDLTP